MPADQAMISMFMFTVALEHIFAVSRLVSLKVCKGNQANQD